MNSFDNLIEVEPLVDLKIINETLSRMGIANKKRKIIYPSAYIYQNFEKYYLAHFKQLFLLLREDAYPNVSEEDLDRLNSIAFCLEKWKLVKILCEIEEVQNHSKFIFVLPFKDKNGWEISHKFNINLINMLR